MRLPFKRLEKEIVRAMKRCYREIINSRPDEALYAFGFYIMSDSGAICVVGNTEELLNATHEKYGDGEDMRWHFGDWGILDEPEGSFDAVNEILVTMNDKMRCEWCDDSNASVDVKRLFDTFVSSLQVFHESGILGIGRDRLKTVLMPVGDVSGDYMYRAISRCNPASIARKMRFLKE